MQKAGLEADIAMLERLRRAHEDDQCAARRQMRGAEREIEVSTRRITEIGEDIARLRPTSGEAFAMLVLGQEYTERKEAGRAVMKEILTLLQLQHDGYRHETLLQRTGADYDIDLAITVTPLGAISRLEHALEGFDDDQRQFRGRFEEAERLLVSSRSRDGGAFALADDLKGKRLKLRATEAQLAADLDNETIAATA
jgi:hypothetical protein